MELIIYINIIYIFNVYILYCIGKIDGIIYYPHFIEFLVTHPIIEMFISPQYQGSIQDKLYDNDKIEQLACYQR